MTEEDIQKIKSFSRNEYGLVDSIEYKFNPNGSIDWRSMVDPKFLYINKEFFQRRKQEIPTSTEGLADNQLLILLAGLKELACLRGFTSVEVTSETFPEKDYCIAKCRIEWIGNYETNMNPIVYEDVANASKENTDSFCHKFLETIAKNRAFVRCVRSFLNIHIVGADEIDKNIDSPSSQAPTVNALSNLSPTHLLEQAAKEDAGITTFEDFKEKLREFWANKSYKNKEAANWNSYSDIPPKEARVLLKLVKSDQSSS